MDDGCVKCGRPSQDHIHEIIDHQFECPGCSLCEPRDWEE